MSHPASDGGRATAGAIAPVALLVAVVAIGAFWIAQPRNGDASTGVSADDDAPAQAQTQVVREREIVFVRADEGEVHVLDAGDGTLIRALAAGEGGFLRGALRPLEWERRRFDTDPTAPYRLVLEAGGRLTLSDPHSDLVLDIDAFGPSSRAEFMTLFPRPEE